ncbi:MAG: DUF2155 domain-containing protein [Elstera sp.]
MLRSLLVLTALVLVSGATLGQQAAPRPPVAQPSPVPQPPAKPVAVLQGLDKVTARVSKLTIPVGEAANFGSLTINVDACIKRPPEEPPENAAFLRIIDHPVQSTAPQKATATPADPFVVVEDRVIFSGWMFASSPALHPLEHPVFDVIVLDCRAG